MRMIPTATALSLSLVTAGLVFGAGAAANASTVSYAPAAHAVPATCDVIPNCAPGGGGGTDPLPYVCDQHSDGVIITVNGRSYECAYYDDAWQWLPVLTG
jgi:hypothetical protein